MRRNIIKKIVSLALVAILGTTCIETNGAVGNTTNIGLSTKEVERKEDKRINEDREGKKIPVVIEEIKKERSENSNTYLLSNGMKKTVYYSHNIRYKEGGKYKDYNPELVKVNNEDKKNIALSKEISKSSAEKYSYVNKAGNTKQYIPEKLSVNSPILLTQDKYRISFVPVTDIDNKEKNNDYTCENVKIEKEEVQNIVTGEEVNKNVIAIFEGKDDVELSYQSMEHGIKEEIILNSIPKNNVFLYKISIENMKAKLDSIGGGVSFIDEDGDKVVAGIPAPIIKDSSDNEYSENGVHYELEEVKNSEERVNTYILKIVVDSDYLKQPEREYPVVIDPSVTWEGTGELGEAYVLKSSADTNYYSSGVKSFSVGKGNQGIFRTYMRALDLKKTVTNKYVESAKMTIYENGTGTKGTKISIQPVAKEFKCSTLTWNNQPKSTGEILAEFTSSGVADAKKTINLTTWARNIAKKSGNGNKNYGLVFKANDESTSSFVKFYGARTVSTAKMPKMEVVYYDGPTKPEEVSLKKIHIKSGEKIQITWSGISSKALDYVQYKVKNYDESSKTTTSDFISYSENTKIGNTSSGLKTINESSEWGEGHYIIYVRGVDKGGIKSEEKGVGFVIDRTVPIISTANITPSTSLESYSKQIPKVTWNINEKYLLSVQAKVNDGNYITIGNANIGSADIMGLVSGQANTVTVRAVDRAGNISGVKIFKYYFDNTKPVVRNFQTLPVTSENNYSDNENPKITFNISDMTLRNVEIDIKNDEGDKKTVYSGSSDQETIVVGKGILKNGLNAIFLHASDKAENDSLTSVIYYYLDTDIPKTGNVDVIPKTNSVNYRSAVPIVCWKGFDDENLKEIQASVNGGTYKMIGKESEGEAQLEKAEFTQNGSYEIKIRAIDKADHTSEEVIKKYYYKNTVSEVEKFKPINVSATEKIGGITIIRFDNKEGEYPDDIQFELYRGTTPLFVPDTTTLIKSNVSHKGAIVSGDNEITYYYKLRAVTVDGEKEYSDFSDEISSTTLAEGEVDSRCGKKDIYEYANFSTPNGNGSIELSKGNLLYEQSDIMLPAPQIPIEVNRIYNSNSSQTTYFGKGWGCAYDATISYASNKLYYRTGTGAIYEFTDNNCDGEYECDKNSELKITQNNKTIEKSITKGEDNIKNTVVFDSQYILINGENDKYYFDEYGNLVLMEEPNGTFLYIERIENTGEIKTVITSSNSKIEFFYNEPDSSGKKYINKICISDGSYFEYEYENGIMTKAVHVGNKGGRIEYKYGYDTNGKLCVITDAMGNEYHIIYNGDKVEKIIYPDYEYILFKISENRTVVGKYTGNDNKLYDEEYVFDTYGKKTSYVDVMGNEYKYDYKGELLKTTKNEVVYYKIINDMVMPMTAKVSDNTEYDDGGNVIQEIDSEGNMTKYKYESTKENLKNLPTEIIVYDINKKEISRKKYGYDNKGNIIRVIDYITNTVCIYSYDEDGNVMESQEVIVKGEDIDTVSINDVQNDNELENSMLVASKIETYDENGNSLTEVLSTDTEYENIKTNYNDIGSEQGVVDDEEISLEYIHDEFGRTVSTIELVNDVKKITENAFDKNGKIKSSKDEVGRVTSYEYDEMGRVIKTSLKVGDDSKITTNEYTYEDVMIHCGGENRIVKNAKVVTVKNMEGDVVTKTYTNNIGQTIRELSNGVCIDYTYDKQGQVFTTYRCGVSEESVQNIVEGKLSVSIHDQNGNLTDEIINPEYNNGYYRIGENSIVTSNIYNNKGLLIKTVNANGNDTAYNYDEQGRLIKVQINNEYFNSYEYDTENINDSGKLKSISTITTDALGRKSKVETNGEGKILSVTDEASTGDIVMSYEYDTSGNMAKIKYSDGRYRKNVYDEYDVLKKSVLYDNENHMVKYSEYAYDSENKLTCKKDNKLIQSVMTPYRYTYYTYDSFGRQTGLSEINSDSDPSDEEIEKYMIKYTYNVDDVVVKIEYPNNLSDKLKGVEFEYNKYNWIINIYGILSNGISKKLEVLNIIMMEK